MRIAVCDDNKVMCDLICKYVINILKVKEIDHSVSSYYTGSLLLQANKNKHFDTIFLDICMPNVDGFQVADIIKKESPKVQIIFITANSELVFKSFDYQPFYFIRKGSGANLSSDILKSINLLLERIKQYTIITLELPYSEKIPVSVKDIIYIENAGHYLIYYLNGLESIKVRGTVDDVEKIMDKYDFIRVHRRYIVNLAHIKMFIKKSTFVILSNGVELDVSRYLKEKSEERFLRYMRTYDN